MKRKILSLLLSVSMLLSLIAPVAAADNPYAQIGVQIDSQTNVVTVNASELGKWEMDGSVSIASDIKWSKDGFDTFTAYATDIVSKANAAGSTKLVFEGCKDNNAAMAVQGWVTKALKLRICPHTHTVAIGEAKEPVPCKETGITPGLRCTDCNGVIYPQQVIPFTHADPVKTEGKAATCTSAGFTAGEACSACGAVLSVSGQKIPALGHSWNEKDICRICGRSRFPGDEIPTYLIAIEEGESSTTTADAHYACAGTLITLRTTLKSGAKLVSVTVRDANGEDLEVTEHEDGTRTFTIMESNVTVTVKSGAEHKVTLSGTYEHGALSADCEKAATGRIVTITANPDEGYVVDTLTVNTATGPIDVICTEENVYTFEMPDANVTVSATFSLPKQTYQVFTEAGEHGKVNPNILSGIEGTTVTASIIPDEGYKVASIEVVDESGNKVGDFTNTSSNISFKMPASNVTIKVTFAASLFAVSKGEVGAHGSITINPTRAQEGASVVVTATPEEGYRLCSLYARLVDSYEFYEAADESPFVFKMPAENVIVFAKFEPLPPDYDVTVVETSNGTVEVSYEDSKEGSIITATVLPEVGYELDSIKVYETETPTTVVLTSGPDKDGQYTFMMPGANVSIEVTFKLISYNITTSKDIENGAIATKNNIKAATKGQMVTVNATPADGYKATTLIGTVVGAADENGTISGGPIFTSIFGLFENNVCTFEMPANDIILTAVFEKLPPEYAIDVEESGNGTISVVPEITSAVAGTNIVIMATPNDGYSLSKITVTSADGETKIATSITNPCVFSMPEHNVKVSAEFTKDPVNHTLTLTPPQKGRGEVKAVFPNTKVGSTITVTATPGKGYEIDTIEVVETESGEVISNSEVNDKGEFTFVMPDCDTTVTVTFKAIEYAISAGEGITLSSETAAYGYPVVVTVTPPAGKLFSKLIVTGEDGEIQTVSMGNNKFRFTMPYGNVTVTAQYTNEAPGYRITINKPTNGTVTTNLSTCKAGTLVTITARGAEGYMLDTITLRTSNGKPVEITDISSGMFTFEMPESNVEISATFQTGTYRINANVIGNGSMNIDAATASMGQTITVTITPDENYELSDFDVTKANGDNISSTRSGNTFRFTMPASTVTVTAKFSKVADPTYTIAGYTPVNGTMRVNPTSAKAGATVTITTTPNSGYALDKLDIRTASGLVVTPNISSTGVHTFVMPNENVTIMATFKRTANVITVADVAHGKISATADKADPGQKVSFVTLPDTDYLVSSVTVTDATGKSVSVSHPADNTFSFTMPDSAVTISAEFVAVPRYTVSLGNMANGSAVLSTTEAKEGTQVSITPKADAGYQIDTVTVRATANSAIIETSVNNGVYTFEMPASNVNVTVTFKETVKPKPDYSITVTTPVNGFVQASSSMAKAGATVTVTTQPKAGYAVDAISVTANGVAIEITETGSNTYTFTMPENNVTINVTFKATAKPITISNSANGSIQVDAETAVPGSRVTITGAPDAGYELKGVTVTASNGTTVSVTKTANGQYSFTMPEQGVTIKGVFSAISVPEVEYSISIADIEHGMAQASHSTAKAGTTVTVTSKPSAGYEFASMTITKADGTRITAYSLGNGAFSFTMPESNVTIKVTFKALTYSVKTTNSTTGTVRTDLARAASGDKVTITPMPNTGYEVESVSVKTTTGKVISVVAEKDGTYIFAMPSEEVTVSAQFKKATVVPVTYTITIAKTEHGKVEAVYDNSTEGSKVTLKAAPDTGYELNAIGVVTKDNKTVKLTSSSESGVYTFTMPANDVTVKATFKAATTSKPTSSITVVSSVHGVTDLSTTSATEGTRVTITTKPDANYVVDSVIVKDAAGKSLTVKKDGTNSYSFTMPAGKVEVTATYKAVSTSTSEHSIIIQSSAYGIVTANPERAAAGTQVTLSVSAYNGYRLDTLTVRDSMGLPIKVSEKLNGTYVFTMPNSKVSVSATFTQSSTPTTPVMYKTVKLSVSGLGKVESSCGEQASPGTTVTITAKPDAGFYLGTMRVTDTAGNPIKLTKKDNETFQFVLPTSNVTVYVSFYQLSSNNDRPILPGTFVDPNQPTNPSNPSNPSIPTLPDSPFDPVNSYQLPFSDMGASSWFYKDVLYLYQRGIVKGVSATGFGPSLTTTRGEVATMLYRLAGEPAVNGISPFTDVAPRMYYSDAIAWAAANGYVNGYSNNTFGPGDKISREQLVTILYRYVSARNGHVDISNTAAFRAFGDSDAVSSYAINAMVWACNTGIIKGDSTNMLKPGASATRAEISAILHRFCEQYSFSA